MKTHKTVKVILIMCYVIIEKCNACESRAVPKAHYCLMGQAGMVCKDTNKTTTTSAVSGTVEHMFEEFNELMFSIMHVYTVPSVCPKCFLYNVKGSGSDAFSKRVQIMDGVGPGSWPRI